MRDFSEDLGDVARRVHDARQYLRIDAARERLTELEKAASEPALWDDPERARKVTSELSEVRGDVDLIDGLEQRLSDVQTLVELADEEGDDSVESEIQVEVDALRALFSGEHDERDAICEVHSGAGGTDAQDWTEMLLRMYSRWAQSKSFDVE